MGGSTPRNSASGRAPNSPPALEALFLVAEPQLLLSLYKSQPADLATLPSQASIRGLLLPGPASYNPASAPRPSRPRPSSLGSAIRVQPPATGSRPLVPQAWLSSQVSTARPPHSQLSLPPPAATLPAWSLSLGPASRPRPPRSLAPAGSLLPGPATHPRTGSLAPLASVLVLHPSSWQNKGSAAQTVPTSSVIPEQLQARTGPWGGC